MVLAVGRDGGVLRAAMHTAAFRAECRAQFAIGDPESAAAGAVR
jgi:hypothetical protein